MLMVMIVQVITKHQQFLYLGFKLCLNQPPVTTYHEVISNSLNPFTLIIIDELTSSSTLSPGMEIITRDRLRR